MWMGLSYGPLLIASSTVCSRVNILSSCHAFAKASSPSRARVLARLPSYQREPLGSSAARRAKLSKDNSIDLIDESLAPDCVNHSPGMPDQPTGPEGVKTVVSMFRSGMPDLRVNILDMMQHLGAKPVPENAQVEDS